MIVAYRSRACLRECLAAVGRADARPRGIVVVDNACPEHSADGLESEFPDVIVLRQATNVGFAAGVNAALRAHPIAGATDVVLLNPDTVPEPGWLDAMRGAFDAHPEAGICGALILDAQGSALDPYQARMLALNGHALSLAAVVDAAPIPMRSVLGAAMGIRGTALRALGGLDPLFFMYGEEIDLCRRARDAGMDVVLTPASRVRHVGEASSTGSAPLRRKTEWLRARNDALGFLKRARVPLRVRLLDLVLRQLRVGTLDLRQGRPRTALLRLLTFPAVLLRLPALRRSLVAEAAGPAHLT